MTTGWLRPPPRAQQQALLPCDALEELDFPAHGFHHGLDAVTGDIGVPSQDLAHMVGIVGYRVCMRDIIRNSLALLLAAWRIMLR